MSLFACGSIHQGHERFGRQSRGKQCSFMSLSALLTAQAIPVIEWDSAIMDSVLMQGDNMYLHSYNNNLIPREGLLLLNNLPTVINKNTSPVDPIVFEPQNNIELRILGQIYLSCERFIRTNHLNTNEIFLSCTKLS